MLGRLDTDDKHVTIIGAGYAGLLSAYRLLKSGYSVNIHEKSSHAGGLISTLQTEYGPAETAAHSIRSSSEILQLFADLDLPYVSAKSKKKYIFRDGKMLKNPLTLWEMFAAGSYAIFKKSEGRKLTLAEWTAQHVGPGAVDNAMAPLSHGIYAAEPEELDQQLAFPRMTIPEGQTFVEKIFQGKAPKEKSFVMAPAFGMGSLIERLTDYVQNHEQGEILFNSDIDTLPDTRNIIISTPATIAGKLIDAPRLANIRYAPMVTATVFLKSSDLPRLEGIGVLNARGEDRKILGILFNSAIFDNRVSNPDYVSVTIMLGGTSNPGILEKSDQGIEDIITSELARILKFNGTPLSIHMTKWPNAIPLYSAELRETLEELKQGWCATPGHILMGNYTGEVSIRGMCQSSLALTH